MSVLLCMLLPGCKSGLVPNLIVGDIEGLVEIYENSSNEYSISSTGDTGITFQWTLEPPDTGELEPDEATVAILNAGDVDEDTPVVLRVIVESDNGGPLVKSLGITIRVYTEFMVGQIAGPETIPEGSTVDYSVNAGGDSGITYEWLCFPEEAGGFSEPDAASTEFTAIHVTTDVPIEIWVAVGSDNHDTILRTRDAVVTDREVSAWGYSWGVNSSLTRATCIATDNDGNIYVGGQNFDLAGKAIDYDPGPGVDLYAGATLMYISKFDAGGDYQWHWNRTFMVSTGVSANDIAIGADSDIYIAGSKISGSLSDYDYKLLLFIVTSGGYENEILQWESISTVNQGGIKSICVGIDGGLLMCGTFSGLLDFDLSYLDDERQAVGKEDAFITMFDSFGDYLWTGTWGGIGYDAARDIAVDSTGNIYVTGYFEDEVDFDPGPGEEIRIAQDTKDIYILSLDAAGNYRWVRTYDIGQFDLYHKTAVAIDSLDDCYVTGNFDGHIDFTPYGPGGEHTSVNGNDAFLLKVNNNGGYIWSAAWGGNGSDNGNAIVIGDSGEVFVAGRFQATVDFDPYEGVDTATAPYDTDGAFLSKFGTDGSYAWVRTWISGSGVWVNDVALDDDGNIFVVGEFLGTVDLNPGPGVDEHSSGFFTSDHANAFFVKLTPDGDWGYGGGE
jgi:hypothetical protein